jgi:Protein of unknown function (DUF2934)
MKKERQGNCMVTSKFDELHAKTERELAHVINSELDIGIREALRAVSAGIRSFREDYYIRARKAYARVARLIPLLEEIPGDRQGPQARLEYLREILDGLSVIASRPAPTRENIAPLARALWKARGCPEGSPDDDWFRAEQALKSERKSHAACC